MKRIIFTSLVIAVALILWGLQKSPHVSESLTQQLKRIPPLSKIFENKEIPLPPPLAEESAQLKKLMIELDTIKASYEEDLTEYKKLDRNFSSLILKSRENPNPKLIKEKQAELDEKFERLTESLKYYQSKSQEIYKFQSNGLENLNEKQKGSSS